MLNPKSAAIIRQLTELLSGSHSAAQGPGIQPGDIVQIHPSADSVFGGLCMRITRKRGVNLEGYLLRPHRSGCKEAWYSFTEGELTFIGSLSHPEPKWGFRGQGRFTPDGQYEPYPESKRIPIGRVLSGETRQRNAR